jgi:hypothetical protein
MQLDELIGKYVEIRDKKSELKKAYDEKAARCDAELDKIEAALLRTFEATGVESMRTDFGTAYKTRRVSCTTADKAAFLDFIKSNDEWALLDARPLKTAVAQYEEEHQAIPPGLNWSSEVVVQIRRS